VVEDVRGADATADDFGADEFAERRIVHRLVRAERNQEIDRGGLAGERVLEQREELRHRHRPRAVGDDEQHTLAGERERREAVSTIARVSSAVR
jgi:hypothetical protein